MNILIGIVLLVVALSFVLVYANTHPPKYPLHIPPSVFKADYEDVSFTSVDGIDLKGWLVKPARYDQTSPAIVICHGVGANSLISPSLQYRFHIGDTLFSCSISGPTEKAAEGERRSVYMSKRILKLHSRS